MQCLDRQDDIVIQTKLLQSVNRVLLLKIHIDIFIQPFDCKVWTWHFEQSPGWICQLELVCRERGSNLQASTYAEKALENRMFALESVKTIISKKNC
jgi:hypothetical protein